jgi:hypothetical protein
LTIDGTMVTERPSIPQKIRSYFRSRKIIAALGAGALVAVILLVVLFLGMHGGQINPGSQQPKVQAANISILQNIEKSPPETIFDDPQVSTLTFQFTTTQPGTYFLNFANSYSTGPSNTKISLSYSIGYKSHNETIYLPPSASLYEGYDVSTNEVIGIQFNVSGGSPNYIHFYITAETCTHSVDFSFNLVNNGTANGNATVQLQGDGTVYWQHAYVIAQGQNLPESGNAFPADCIVHNFNVNVTAVEKM